jgi:hypothetical protein
MEHVVIKIRIMESRSLTIFYPLIGQKAIRMQTIKGLMQSNKSCSLQADIIWETVAGLIGMYMYLGSARYTGNIPIEKYCASRSINEIPLEARQVRGEQDC